MGLGAGVPNSGAICRGFVSSRRTRKVVGGGDERLGEPYRFSGLLGSRPNGERAGFVESRWLSMRKRSWYLYAVRFVPEMNAEQIPSLMSRFLAILGPEPNRPNERQEPRSRRPEFSWVSLGRVGRRRAWGSPHNPKVAMSRYLMVVSPSVRRTGCWTHSKHVASYSASSSRGSRSWSSRLESDSSMPSEVRSAP